MARSWWRQHPIWGWSIVATLTVALVVGAFVMSAAADTLNVYPDGGTPVGAPNQWDKTAVEPPSILNDANDASYYSTDRTETHYATYDNAASLPANAVVSNVTVYVKARGNLSPKDVLRRVNERMVIDTKENVFTTMTYGILDLQTGRLKFVRAGHEPLLILNETDRAFAQHTPQGIALGLISGELFNHTEEAEVDLRPGEMVLLYTDGVIEAMDQNSREYGRERLIRRIRSAERPTAEGLVRSVLEDINLFTLGIPQHDDITLLALRHLPREEAVEGGAALDCQTA
jgi:hypothetical protein